MKFWENKNLISNGLLPMAGLYRMGMALRRFGYVAGFKKVTRFSVPVIVVGNISVGGAGKTPLVICIANKLQQEGWRPGIVSRGYKGSRTDSPQRVVQDSDPRLVGDEPVLIAQKTACPVMVCRNRVAAVAKLLRDEHCNIIVSDDGLQHLALGRDIEIAVIDGEKRFGNNFCLPAGPLREPVNRLKTVDFIVNNGASVNGEWRMDLKPESVYQLLDNRRVLTPADVQAKKIYGVAAIGNPNRFFNLLDSLSFLCVRRPFRDHYFFQKKDLDFEKDAIIIMTEKDAVKCRDFADDRYWCLSVEAQLSTEFFQSLLERIQRKQ